MDSNFDTKIRRDLKKIFMVIMSPFLIVYVLCFCFMSLSLGEMYTYSMKKIMEGQFKKKKGHGRTKISIFNITNLLGMF